jgi:hypothetical protein
MVKDKLSCKRSAQDSLFECGQAFRAFVGDHSFYVYLADHRHELFSDETHPEPPSVSRTIAVTMAQNAIFYISCVLSYECELCNELALYRYMRKRATKAAAQAVPGDQVSESIVCAFRGKGGENPPPLVGNGNPRHCRARFHSPCSPWRRACTSHWSPVSPCQNAVVDSERAGNRTGHSFFFMLRFHLS